MDVVSLIMQHEGVRLKAYTDTRGRVTIGTGRNLTDKGISHEENLMLFQRDYTEALNAALEYPWYQNLSEPRQAVIVDMVFELGDGGFAQFKTLHTALSNYQYDAAAEAMMNSLWAREVPRRAQQDAQIMRSGLWPVE